MRPITLFLFLFSGATALFPQGTQTQTSTTGGDSGNQAAVPVGSAPTQPTWLAPLQSDCVAKPLTAACSLLMEVYLDGRLIKPDPASATAYVNQSCDLGNG